MPGPKRYDRAYFDRWYRDPRHRVAQGGVLERRVQLAVAAAEFVLERPIRNVLDVGCGEAPWRAMLLHARPGVRYLGVDSSEYVVRRFGRSRNIRLGAVGALGDMTIGGPFDLIVCSDVLHYVATAELKRGLCAMAGKLAGVAFLEVYPREDDTIGDDQDYRRRSASSYRRWFRAAGLIPLGLHCYAGRALADGLGALERAGR